MKLVSAESSLLTSLAAEENLDLILLVIRNAVQFLRLFNILRRWVRLVLRRFK
jgi:hypothetical protein